MKTKNSDAQSAQYTPDDLSSFKDEIIKQATHSIKEEFSGASEKLKDSQNTLKSRLKLWFSDQFGRLSNTLIALLFASLATVLMPIFVKSEVDQEFNHYNEYVVNMVNNLVTEELNQSTEGLRIKNSEISKSMTVLQQKINELETDASKNQYSDLKTQLNSLQLTLQAKYEAIDTKVNALKNDDALKISHSKSVIDKINYYKLKGQSLISKKANEQEIVNWIEEVYYFVSLIKFDHLDMTAAKQSLFDIYKMDTPSVSSDHRIQSSVVILNAVTEGIQLSNK